MRRGKRTLVQPREGGRGSHGGNKHVESRTIQSQYFSTPCILDLRDIRNLCTDYDITNTKLSFLINNDNTQLARKKKQKIYCANDFFLKRKNLRLLIESKLIEKYIGKCKTVIKGIKNV